VPVKTAARYRPSNGAETTNAAKYTANCIQSRPFITLTCRWQSEAG
jgi:hypothetical protein